MCKERTRPVDRARRYLGLTLAASLLGFLLPACSATTGGAEPITFGVVADVQYADKEVSGTRRYREAVGKLEEAVLAFNELQPDFVIQLGDVVDGNGERTAGELDSVLTAFDRLACDLRHVVGNHCLDEGRALYDARVELEEYHYDFGMGDWHFIVLDGNDVSTRDHPEHSPQYRRAQEYMVENPENKPWNGAVGDEQLEWLAERLEWAERMDRKVIVFCHFPTHVAAAGGQRTVVLWNHEEVLRVLAGSSCVMAYIAGHHHDGAYVFHEGVHHLTFPAICDAPPGGNAWAVVELHADRMVVRGHGSVPSRELELRRP